MQPGRLSALARQLPDEKRAALLDYLETLTSQQERDLAGTGDRLAILAESDVQHWLDPRTTGEKIDLRASLETATSLCSDSMPIAGRWPRACWLQR
jgi:putative SOS response-associated peptidase YedK